MLQCSEMKLPLACLGFANSTLCSFGPAQFGAVSEFPAKAAAAYTFLIHG